MALIKCPECEYLISDKAHTCPKCGFPYIEYRYSREYLLNCEKENSKPNGEAELSIHKK